MSSFCKCKSYSLFFSKNISVYTGTIFSDQNFNNMLTNDIVSFEQLGPTYYLKHSISLKKKKKKTQKKTSLHAETMRIWKYAY